MSQQKQVLLALSGGVDSSVACKLLQQQGYEVRGLVLRFSPAHDGEIKDARRVAQDLGVTLDVVDCGDAFEEMVIHPFCAAYTNAQTPNPCIICNPMVKFNQLAAHADRLGIHYVATGHYATVTERDGSFYITKAASRQRDQSYMLYRLGQPLLRRLILPLGQFSKEQVRALARDYHLSSADRPDSQEICFIPDDDYAKYIEERGYTSPKGRFIGPDGQDLGSHKGIMHYTVGQRKGLGISFGEPLYVDAIKPNGTITLRRKGVKTVRGITLDEVVATPPEGLQNGTQYGVKIRSAGSVLSGTLHNESDGTVVFLFDAVQAAATPGQHGVFYDGDLVVGGGRIATVIRTDENSL